MLLLEILFRLLLEQRKNNMSIKNKLIRLYYYYIKKESIKCAKLLGVRIGEKCKILDDPGKVFGSEPWLVQVGNHCEFTNGVRILTHEGAIWVPRFLDKSLRNCDIMKPVKIGNNFMVGQYSIIMPGVTIGSNVIIGSHSVVTKDVEDNSVVAGIPAKRIKSIDKFISECKNSPYLMPIKNMEQFQKKEYIIKNRSELLK